jgi:hypothetical protein
MMRLGRSDIAMMMVPTLLLLVSLAQAGEVARHPPISEAEWQRRRARAVVGTAPAAAAAASCPAELAAAVAASGLLSIELFALSCGNITIGGNSIPDAACMTESAVNASILCGGSVFLPPSKGWTFARTVFINGQGPSIVGAESIGGGAAQFAVPPQARIRGPVAGPAFCVGCKALTGGFGAQFVSFENLQIVGWGSAVWVNHSAEVRFKNVAASAQNDYDGVNTTKGEWLCMS